MNRTLLKNVGRQMWRTKSRFFSILAIIALGCGFFAGVKATSPDMKLTAEQYFKDYKLMDVQLLSTVGFDQQDLAALRDMEGIGQVAGSYSADLYLKQENGSTDVIVKIYSLNTALAGSDDPSYINRPVLVEGRLPQNANECVVERTVKTPDSFQVGNTITLATNDPNRPLDEILTQDTFTIVGIVEWPMYISFNRGSSSIGDGSVNSFVLLSEEAYAYEAYTGVFLTLDGAEALSPYSEEYDVLVNQATERLEDFSNGQVIARCDRLLGDARQEIADGQAELEQAKTDLEDAKSDLEKGLADGRKMLDETRAALEQKKKEYQEGLQALEQGKQELSSGRAQLEQSLKDARQKLDDASAELEANRKTYQEGEASYQSGKKAYDQAYAALQAQMEQTGSTPALEQALAALQVKKAELEKTRQTLDATKTTLDQAEQILNQQESAYASQKQLGETKLNNAEQELRQNEQNLQEAKIQLAQAEQSLTQGEQELAERETDGLQKIAEAELEINNNEKKLQDAQAEVDKTVTNAKWYVMDRSSNVEYDNFEVDSDRVDAIAKVFPIFFILVAALVCFNTMMRMVEEQRTEIGTLKALGYHKGAIVSQFLLYAVSASLIGGFLGLLIGFQLFPGVIFNAYRIIYNMPALIAPFRWDYAAGCLAAAVLVTTLSSLLACYKELAALPAQLMRPKPPKNGKRVLLERIRPLWSHLSFARKVTVRNLARYKSRVLMTIIGIAGCTALLLTGFGLKDSISAIVSKQYGDIFHYDVTTMLQEDISAEQQMQISNYLSRSALAEQSMFVFQESLDAQANGKTQNVYLVSPEDVSSLSNYITLQDRKTKAPVPLTDDGIVITEKLGKLLGVGIGDTVTLPELGETPLPITGITENYAYHFIYITPSYYEKIFGQLPKQNVVYTNLNGDASYSDFSEQLLTYDGVLGASYTEDTNASFQDIISSLNYVVMVIILSAGALAFVVLYNLANININERIHELATIKVLGFTDLELSAYIYRENIISSLAGMIIGLFGGIFLTRFVVQTAEVDIVMFSPDLPLYCFLLAALVTIVFVVAVNFVLYFRLKKIDMATSLKAIE